MSIRPYNPYQAIAREHEPLAYLFDGTFEGMLTCVYLAAKAKESPCDIISAENVQLRFGQKERTVGTDMDAALMVKRSIMRNYGSEVFAHLQLAAASDAPDAALTVFSFARKLLGSCRACAHCDNKAFCTKACQTASGSSILDDLADPLTGRLEALRRSVINEEEHMRQFVRFQHLDNDIWFARCNPNARVIPFVMPWFAARFNTQRFVIYDEVHRMSGIYDGHHCHMVQGEATPPSATADDALMQQAWKRYFDSLCVTERYNPELQRQLMPKRFWKNLTEMQPDLSNEGARPCCRRAG